MTIDPETLPETLMAYADGELSPLAAKRVERAIAADPALGEQVARHRALGEQLRGAFAAVEHAPVPAALEAMVRDSAKVTPIAPPPPPPRAAPRPARWIGALAASLVVGLLVGRMLPPSGSEAGIGIALEDGRPVARGALAGALDSQLASTQPADAPVRIGLTFRDAAGDLCRTFQQDGLGGIACAAGGGWRLARLYGDMPRQTGAYRQAGSTAMMADAQAMMAGAPLDARVEEQALKDRANGG